MDHGPAGRGRCAAAGAATAMARVLCNRVEAVFDDGMRVPHLGTGEIAAPHHLQNVAYLVGLTVLGGTLIGPVTSAVELARNPIRRGQMKRGRLAIVAAIALAAIVAVLAIPVNYNVTAPWC